MDREQGEGRELQGEDEQGAGGGPAETEVKCNKHGDEVAEPQVALDIHQREPAVEPREPILGWNKQREELAEEPELELRLSKPTVLEVEAKNPEPTEADHADSEMSLGFMVRLLRSKLKNSSTDSCKSVEAYQEVQLQEERRHDGEAESLACASEPTEARHTDSEMQEDFSNQLKFTKDLPSTKYPKLPLENYPSQKIPGHCNGTMHVNTVSDENRNHKRVPNRGRGKFSLCSVRRPGFNYQDATGTRPKNVLFRERPDQEDLNIFEETDTSSSTLSKVNSSRIVREGIYYNFNAAATSFCDYEFFSSPEYLSHFQGVNTYYLLQTYQQGPAVPVLPVWMVSLHSCRPKSGLKRYPL